MASQPKPKQWRSWRRKLLTQDLVDEAAGYFRQGDTIKVVAGRIGVPAGVLRGWLTAGDRDLTEVYDSDVGYPEPEGLLYYECAKATAEYLHERIETVTDPGDAEWRASSWLLERRDEDFNPASKVEVTGQDGAPIQFEGKAVVGLADIFALVQKLGYADRYRLGAGDPGGALPALAEVLPDPALDLGSAVGAPALAES